MTARLGGIATSLTAASLATLAAGATPRRVLAAVTLPADITLFARGRWQRSGSGRSLSDLLDGIAVVVTLGGLHTLWLRTWWRGRRLIGVTLQRPRHAP